MKTLDEINEELKEENKDLISRIEALEMSAIKVEHDIARLTNSDDLEKTKAKVNEIVNILSRY